MNESLLVARGLKKTFTRKLGGNVEVLKSVSLEIAPRESIAILGKSGSGKSTLLHLLGTLESPTEGEVLFEGKNVFKYGESALSRFRNAHLGFVFQFHYLMLEFTALENVMMPALIAGESRKAARDRALDLLGRVGLSDRLSHKPPQLSGGEQQRVAIARALVRRPKLLLTDEMTGNLDPVTGGQIFTLIRSLHAEFAMALVSVTHDETLARQYDRVHRLTDGVLH